MANYCCADFNTIECNLEVNIEYLKILINGMKKLNAAGTAQESVTLGALASKSDDYTPTYAEIKSAIPDASVSTTTAQNNVDGLSYSLTYNTANQSKVLKRSEITAYITNYSGITISNSNTTIAACGGTSPASTYNYKFTVIKRECGETDAVSEASGTLADSAFGLTGATSGNRSVTFDKNQNGSTRTATQKVNFSLPRFNATVTSNTLTFTQNARSVSGYTYSSSQSAATDVKLVFSSTYLTGCGNQTVNVSEQIKYDTWYYAYAYDTCGDRWSAQDVPQSGKTSYGWTEVSTSSHTENGCTVMKDKGNSYTWNVSSNTYTKYEGGTIQDSGSATWEPADSCAETCYGACSDVVTYSATGGTVNACGSGTISGTKTTQKRKRNTDGSCEVTSTTSTSVSETITGTSAASIENNGTSNRTVTFYSANMSRSISQPYPCRCIDDGSYTEYSGETLYLSCSDTSYTVHYKYRTVYTYTNCSNDYSSWSSLQSVTGTCSVNRGTTTQTITSNSTYGYYVYQYGSSDNCGDTCYNKTCSNTTMNVTSSSSSSSKHGQSGVSNIQIGSYTADSCVSISNITSNNTSNVSNITWGSGNIYATLPDKSGWCNSTAATTVTVAYSVHGSSCTSKTFTVYQDANTTVCPTCDCSTFIVTTTSIATPQGGETNATRNVGWARGANCDGSVGISSNNTSMITNVSTGSSGSIIITSSANSGTSSRSATLTFSYNGTPCTGRTVTVTQDGVTPTCECSDASVTTTGRTWSFSGTGSSNSQNIATTSTTCGYFVLANVPSWITTGTSGSYIYAYPNSSCTTGCTSRSATITIQLYYDGSKKCDKTTVTVTQNCSKSISISASPSSLTCSGGTVTFSIS